MSDSATGLVVRKGVTVEVPRALVQPRLSNTQPVGSSSTGSVTLREPPAAPVVRPLKVWEGGMVKEGGMPLPVPV